VFLFHQVDEPAGYDDVAFHGVWPQGGVWVVKSLMPPNMKGWRTPGNWHTVTLIMAAGPNPSNHLMLGPSLQRLVSHYCDCQSGNRTNSCCSHVMALVIGLFAPTLFKSTKVSEPRLQDPLRFYSTPFLYLNMASIPTSGLLNTSPPALEFLALQQPKKSIRTSCLILSQLAG
jgi:hypothetical protein